MSMHVDLLSYVKLVDLEVNQPTLEINLTFSRSVRVPTWTMFLSSMSLHTGGVQPQLSPPPDGAFQVSGCSQSDGVQMEVAVCVLPRGHSTRPLLRHCFSASLEASLTLFLHHLTSQAARQMAAATATYIHTHGESQC